MTGTRADARKSREALSEAELHMVARCDERRREVVQRALESIMSGASLLDADAFLIALSDEDARVVVGP